MEEEWEGAKTISMLMGLSGLALVTFLLWGGLFWPFGLIAFEFLFPFVQRHFTDIFLAPIFYGTVELAIAYGFWIRSKSSRIAFICLGFFWIAYAIWDSLTIREGTYGNSDYYRVDPFVAANAAIYGIMIVYLFFSKKARVYFGKKENSDSPS